MSTKKNKLDLEKIKAVTSATPSPWAAETEYRLKNRKWLDYSAKIALRVDAILEDKTEWNQVTLAKELDMPPQQVSRILRGDQNLTLKTIAKLSTVLGVELISFPPYKDSFVAIYEYGLAQQPSGAKVIPLRYQEVSGLEPYYQEVKKTTKHGYA